MPRRALSTHLRPLLPPSEMHPANDYGERDWRYCFVLEVTNWRPSWVLSILLRHALTCGSRLTTTYTCLDSSSNKNTVDYLYLRKAPEGSSQHALDQT